MAELKEDYRKEERINGIVYDMSPSADYRHGIVNSNIHAILKQHLDVMLICDRKHLKGGAYTGVPRFIAETLSPATALKDKTVKKEIYQAAGVSEYWIVSPKERAVEIYYLEQDNYILKYSYILQDDPEDIYYNADTVIYLREFPNITMKLEEIFENIEV